MVTIFAGLIRLLEYRHGSHLCVFTCLKMYLTRADFLRIFLDYFWVANDASGVLVEFFFLIFDFVLQLYIFSNQFFDLFVFILVGALSAIINFDSRIGYILVRTKWARHKFDAFLIRHQSLGRKL